MIVLEKTNCNSLGLRVHIKQYEYEITLLVFLLLRFFFKNILGLTTYFTQETIFGFSDSLSIIIGIAVVLCVCLYLSYIFGQIIKANGSNYENPVILLVALFFACPASLPFLFDTNSLSGTQMLYPFALFILSVSLINKPVVKWIVPLVCAVFFIPSVHTPEVFFSVLRKGAVLYVPLLLMTLFLNMMRENIAPTGKKKNNSTGNSDSAVLFDISIIVSLGSFVYTLLRGTSFYEASYGAEQNINWYFLICLVLVAPALGIVCAVLHKALNNNFSLGVFGFFITAPLLMLLLTKNNYYGLWIPFLTISLFLLIFYSIHQKNPAILTSVRSVGDYLSEHKFAFYIILIAMASLSNVSSNYLSDTFQKIFAVIPY